jgi:hypothetical protein
LAETSHCLHIDTCLEEPNKTKKKDTIDAVLAESSIWDLPFYEKIKPKSVRNKQWHTTKHITRKVVVEVIF